MNFLSTLPHGNNVFAISEYRFHVLNSSEKEAASFPINNVIIGYSDIDDQYYIRLPHGITYVSSNSEFTQFYNIFKDLVAKPTV
ncbi:hypothetical protein BK131_04475 [Paenibacillus amylolyticus]|uniref:Uncharacterized protein n=1 Tax=Paenibacillus amylolyticus TaxID=1451 RepID=A0A1R1C533_PAEAM|nr:hypothetical protein BK131_04475 [Paenibacillus amylolyticus]